jgi:multiple sugar transport system permease protein
MKSRNIIVVGFSYFGLFSFALLFIAPVVFMLIGSLKPESRVLIEAGNIKAFLPIDVDFRNYHDVFARVDFSRYLFNSLFITSMVVGGGLVVNSLAGYAFSRLDWRGRRILFALVLAILILPLETIAVPLFYQVTMFGWRDTYLVQIIPFVANAFSIYLFYTFFLGLPREFEEAARLDGAGALRTFVTIIVPNSKPVFATVAILSFLMQWGVFLWPLMVTSSQDVRPLPLAIATFYTLPPLQWGDIFAFGVMMVVPVLLVFLFFQRWFIRGVIATGIKG